MSHKFKSAFTIIGILLIAMLTMAFARGWMGPLAQTGMDMPTDTMQPQSTSNPDVTAVPTTPTPLDTNQSQSVSNATVTSIFTGYTPYPTANSTYYPSTGGSGMAGSCQGMSGGGGMGSGAMGAVGGVITGTTGMAGMGSMDSGSMEMNGCSMMSGMGMTGAEMSDGNSMAGMNMSDDMWIEGMDRSAAGGYAEENSLSVFSDPWLILGWVLLVMVVIVILVAAGFGIAWIIRRSSQNPSA